MHRLFLAFFASSLAVTAADVRTLQNDHFATGRSVRVSETVVGDLIAAGRNVVIDGAVAGDAMVAGGEVRIDSAIDQSVYGAGGRIVLSGSVGENARIAGGNVEIAPSGEINGNASIGGGEVLMNGTVDGYLQAAGGHVLINGPVGGDVEASAGVVELGPKAFIAGNLRYTSSQELRRDPGARVAGDIERTAPPVRSAWARSAIFIAWTAGLMLLAAILVAVWPSFYSRVDATLRSRLGMSMLLGLAAMIVIPIAALILLVTLVGIPLALLTLALFVALILAGYVTANVALGDWALSRWKPDRADRVSWRSAAAALSVLVVAIIGQAPVLGVLLMFAVLIAGIGSLALQFKRG